jgi:hypothetical protein
LLWARQAVGSAVSGGLHNDILAAYSGNGAAAPTGDDFCYSVAVDSVDNIYCGGKTSSSLLETHGNGGLYSDIFIVKLDSNGLLQGGFQPGLHSQGTPPCGDGDFDGFDDCDPSGSYIPAGTFQTQFESATAAFGGGETYYEQSCLSILVDSSTNIYCAGETEYSFGEQSNAGTSDDIFIMKFDSALNLSWVRQFGNNYSYNQLNSFAASNGGGSTGSSEKCAGIATDNSGSVVCAGWTEGGSLAEEIGGSIDLVVIKMDSAGDLVWSRQAGAQGRYTTNQIPSF